MKLTCSNGIDRNSLDGDTPDARLDSFVDKNNVIARQVVNTINGGIDLSNTLWRTATYDLNHGVATKIRSPLSELGLRTTDIIATGCIGVTLDSQNKTTRQNYALGLPSVEWHISSSDSDSCFVTATYPPLGSYAEFQNTADQPLSVNTITPVTWSTQNSDLLSNISLSSNSSGPTTSRITVLKNGIYELTGQLTWQSNALGRRFLATQKNSNGAFTGEQRGWDDISANAADVTAQTILAKWPLKSGEYVEIIALQDGIASLNLLGTVSFRCRVQVQHAGYTSSASARGRVRLLFLGEA